MIALLPKELAHARERLQKSIPDTGNPQIVRDGLTADLNRLGAAPHTFEPTLIGRAPSGLAPVHPRLELRQPPPQLFVADGTGMAAAFSRCPGSGPYPDTDPGTLDCLEAQPFSFADSPFFRETWNGMNMACFPDWAPTSRNNDPDGSGSIGMNTMDMFDGGASKGMGLDMNVNVNMDLDQVRQMINNNTDFMF
jgi:hypothetical protein